MGGYIYAALLDHPVFIFPSCSVRMALANEVGHAGMG